MGKQYRTKGREILISYFESLGGISFCVKDIMEYLEKSKNSMNQATVYRNIEKLVANNKLIKYKKPNEDICYYQYVGEDNHCHEHLHIQCKKCSKIIHLEDTFMDTFYQYIQKDLSVSLELTESILIGLCEKCK